MPMYEANETERASVLTRTLLRGYVRATVPRLILFLLVAIAVGLHRGEEWRPVAIFTVSFVVLFALLSLFVMQWAALRPRSRAASRPPDASGTDE